MVKFNSTIFRTIKDEATGANKSIGLFGKSFAELKNIISSVKTNGLFNTSTISEADVECIKKYNNAIALNFPHQQAMEQATKGASDATKQMIKNANGNTIALDKMTLGAKAANIAMNLLSTAMNMAIMWGISKLITAWDDYKEKLREVAQETAEQAEESSNHVQSLLELQEQLKEGTTSTEDLTTAFREQLRVMGYTEEEVDNLIDKYNGLSGAIKGATEEALNTAKIDANTAKVDAGEVLEAEYFGQFINSGANYNGVSSETYQYILDTLNLTAKRKSDNIHNGSYTEWVAKSDSADDIYEYYQGLLDIKKKIEQDASDTQNDELLASIFYVNLKDATTEMSEYVDAYGDAINKLHNADAQIELSNHLKTNDIDSQGAFNAYIDEIKDSEEYFEAYKQVLISVANDAFPQFSASAKDASDSVSNFNNKIDVSLDSYKKASDGISSLATAFKELTDNEYISLETISKIKEAVGDSISNWSEYEEKLLSVKKGTEEYNQLMRELTYATLEKQLGGVNALANADEKYVARLLEENGVLNANEVAHSAIAQAVAKSSINLNDETDVIYDNVDALVKSGEAAGVTCTALFNLIAQEKIFNNTGLSVSQKVTELEKLAKSFGITIASAKAAKEAIANVNTTRQGVLDGTKSVKDLVASKKDEANVFEDMVEDMFNQINVKFGNIENPKYSSDSSKNNKNQTAETFDWIETKISRLQRKIINLGNVVSDTFKSWSTRNKNLTSEITAITTAIDTQEKATAKYKKQADSVKLSSSLKKKVREGAIDIDTIKDDKTKENIKKYQDYYNKYLESLDNEKELKSNLNAKYREQFDLIAKQYDSEISLVEANISNIESLIDQAEMKGNLVSKNYYSAMYKEEEKNLSFLQQKYEKLSNKLSDGTVKKGTEEWNAMNLEIKETKQTIIESTTALEEYQKTMRELDWKVFDLGQEKISDLIGEGEFLIDLLGNSKLFNDDGSITSQGQATLGLHVANLKVYENQIQKYAKAIEDLDNEFANDPLDQNYLERRQNLVESQRDAILAAQEEKNSIKDLYSEGYNNLLSYMDKLISKRKELLSQASNARSFQKNIQEQTDEIARLQNIINSYNGDLSEEAKASIQKYEVELKDAESNLEDTLYDKYISDQEKMLDALADDANQWVNERLDKIDGLIEDAVSATDKNAETIKSTIETEVSAVGGSLSTEMQNIWSGADGVEGVIGGVNDTLLDIKNLVQSMVDKSDKEASKNTSNATANVKPTTKPTTTPTTTPNKSNTNDKSSTSAKTIKVGGMINAGSALIYDYAGDKSGERQYYRSSPYYRVLDEKNGYLKVRHQSLSSGTTGWFKKSDVKAYKTGGLVDETGLAWLDGTKSKPEMVLNPYQTENYLKLTKALDTVAKTNMFDTIQDYAKIPNIPNTHVQNQEGNITFDIKMYGINDPQEMAQQIKKIYQNNINNVRKTIRADVYGGMLNKNSLTRYKY